MMVFTRAVSACLTEEFFAQDHSNNCWREKWEHRSSTLLVPGAIFAGLPIASIYTDEGRSFIRDFFEGKRSSLKIIQITVGEVHLRV